MLFFPLAVQCFTCFELLSSSPSSRLPGLVVVSVGRQSIALASAELIVILCWMMHIII